MKYFKSSPRHAEHISKSGTANAMLLRVINASEFVVIDPEADRVLKVLSKPRHMKSVYTLACNSFIGIDARLQCHMAEWLCLHYNGEAKTFTGFVHIDLLLARLYKAIDAAKLGVM